MRRLTRGLIRDVAAQAMHLFGAAQLRERLERRLDQVVRITRPEPLGQDIADSRQLDHRAHAARRDYPGALSRRTQHDPAGAETSDHLMRYGPVLNRHPDQTFLGAIDTLANRLRHFVGLAETEADQSVVISRDDQCAEAEAPSTLHDFRDAVDMDDLLFDLEALRIDPLDNRPFFECALSSVQ